MAKWGPIVKAIVPVLSRDTATLTALPVPLGPLDQPVRTMELIVEVQKIFSERLAKENEARFRSLKKSR